MADRELTPEQSALIERMQPTDIPVVGGTRTFDQISPIFGNGRAPIIAVHIDSHPPTDEEVSKIEDIGRAKISRLFVPSEVHGWYADGARITILKKIDEKGIWTYRDSFWTVGPTWFPIPGSLEELEKRINFKYS